MGFRRAFTREGKTMVPMGDKKPYSVQLRVSVDDMERLVTIAKHYECSRSHAIRMLLVKEKSQISDDTEQQTRTSCRH